MKKLVLSLYEINELQQEEKQTAIQNNDEIIIDNNYWWYEHIYEDFTELMKYVGVEVENIFFDLSGQQEGGSDFKSEIKNAYQFIKKVQNEEWTKYAPSITMNIPQLPIQIKTLNMIKNGTLKCEWKTRNNNRSNYLVFETDYYLNKENDYIDRKGDLMKEIIKLEAWMENVLNQFNNYLFHLLTEEYWYLTSGEAVSEYCEEQEILFLQNGQRVDQEWIKLGKVI